LSAVATKAAQHVHAIVGEEKSAAPERTCAPKFFNEHQYATQRALCQAIIPSDDRSGGAIEAGAPEFIDLLTSENIDYQVKLGGGMLWLDAECHKRFGQTYLKSLPEEQKQILDLIAYRANAAKDHGLSQGVAFFAFLRNLTLDGFYTSKIGIEDLQYIGNDYLNEFPGCPPFPEA
jgi:gluconate 2-dehydrogenase gamma chain